ALDRTGGEGPGERRALEQLVRGALSDVLQQRLGAQQGDALASELAKAIDETPVSGPHRRGQAFELATTIGTQTGPARLVVVARGTGLAERLRAAVGADGIAVAPAADPARGGQLAHEMGASMVVVDTTDVPEGGTDAFVDGLGGLPDDMMVVVWGTGGPEVETMQEELAFCGLRVTTLDRREGIEPLIDLMRAHRGGRG
ncbi:MAG: hypothetical protein ACOCUS_06470, partial [Polyangiales bacterium]